MKKYIKTLFIILIAIFILGITASEMLAADNSVTTNIITTDDKNGEISIITKDDSKENKNYCMDRWTPVWNDAILYKAQSSRFYPSDDIFIDSTTGTIYGYGYSKAYLYVGVYDMKINSDSPVSEARRKELVQNALYWLSEKGKSTEISEIAKGYQNFKANEKELTINDTNARVFNDDENMIYGPIMIDYSYMHVVSGKFYDDWGGLIYTFVDKAGNNISDKVKLCVLKDGVYEEVQSEIVSLDEDVEINGYYQIKTVEYAGENLYIVAKDVSITNVSLIVRGCTTEYEVKCDYLVDVPNEEYHRTIHILYRLFGNSK